MSQYGSTGNLSNFRDRTSSPAAYSNLGRNRDDYNRYETQRHAQSRSTRAGSQEESRFGGFGDRPGSGVELTSHNWSGGEIITDPNQLPRGLKTRKIYYSPIGDGTVAADGYELKRRPVDLTPRVTITQMQHVERGDRGHDGLNIYEKSWTNTMGSNAPSDAGFGSEFGGPGSGRNSRAGAMSPPAGDPFGKGLGGLGAGGPGAGDGLGSGGPPYGRGGTPMGSTSGRPESSNRDPYGTLDSRGPPYTNGNNDGRHSVASTAMSDPAYRFDMKQGYLITNPRELIHQYATTTPVAIMDAADNTPSTTTVSKQSMYRKTEETTEERFAPYAPYKSTGGSGGVPTPNRFVRQLRDDTMTNTQREANTHMDALNQRDPNANQRISEIRQRTYTSTSSRGGDDIDSLTQQLVSGLHTGVSRF